MVYRRKKKPKYRFPAPEVDYRNFRLRSLSDTEYKHLKLLLYWPLFGFLFLFVERIYQVDRYYPVSCSLDGRIPFCEWFLFPYLFWFLYMVGMHLYTLLYDIEAFRKLMKFIMISFSVTILIYLLFPTCQELRPTAFERDNALTRFMRGFYQFDTNTNVCPSLHVTGSLAVMFTAFHCKRLQGLKWKLGFGITAFLICVSTVFLKQHSVVDVAAAIPISLIAYGICFLQRKGRRGL